MKEKTMPAARLYLIRHGETAANRSFRYIGARDDELNETGVRQALQLADALAVLPIVAIYSSPLRRASATAAAIATAHDLEVRIAGELRESSFGAWEGLSRAEVLARSPADARTLRAWEHDATVAPPDGESFAAVQQRVRASIEQLTEVHAGQEIALVSHVGPIKVLLAAALDVPISASFRIFLDPATISVIDWQAGGGGQTVVHLVNSHAHLGWTAARWMR